nr:hypothetical protein [uncultured Flavobacterium sp.]
MKNVMWSLCAFVCVAFTSYSQTKSIEKGTYLSTNKGQKIKLNLLDNDKYELVFYSGDYEVKGDSLLFKKPDKLADVFDLEYSKEKNIKSKKVKVKFLDAYNSFYLGTQSGAQDVVYQKIKIDYDANPSQTDVEVEIDQPDFMYLVYEGYDGKSSVCKYALPKEINQVVVKYSPDVMGDLNISGYFDPKTNELILGDKLGKNPLVFQSEKNAIVAGSNSKITPVESLIIPYFTYPGKEPLLTEDIVIGEPVDTTAADGDWKVDPPMADSELPKVDFKFKIENNLKDAIATTQKAPNKFLIVYKDSKNPSAKADFDAFIKDQQITVGYYFYDAYKPEFDRFNFYLTSKSDDKWLKSNKIEGDPAIVVLDNDGTVLATAQSGLRDKSYQLNYYDPLCKNLEKAQAFYTFKKLISSKKPNDDNLILAFNKIAGLDVPYDYDPYYTDQNPKEFKIDYPKFDKKQIDQTWNSLIVAHQKDAKPNMYLVETILREIKNVGFTKQFFNEEKILNDTDFLAIDYVIKHADAIETERATFNATENELHLIGNISSEIPNALSQSSYLSIDGGATKGNFSEEKVISVYKKLISSGKGNYDSYKYYFDYLKSTSPSGDIDARYLKEFDSFFNTYLSPEKSNALEQLDKMYDSVEESSEGYYGGWKAFKEYCSNACNDAAWSVVKNSENVDFLKNAITWSEYSLIISKNNAYYLDTLAQLYYKEGQKEKAIATQKQAVKYSTKIEEETAAELKEVLSKMQNGTY